MKIAAGMLNRLTKPFVAACLVAWQLPTASAAEVVVTGSARAQQVLDAPFAITVVDASALRDAGPMVNLSEVMARVPGLVVNNRNNYAQDLQISSRGFGARAAFGVRGLRLYADGIPATMPDGQGQAAHFDLAAAQRIEVLRGPLAQLYGNAAGGVVQIFTGSDATAPTTTLRTVVGRDGLVKDGLTFAASGADPRDFCSRQRAIWRTACRKRFSFSTREIRR